MRTPTAAVRGGIAGGKAVTVYSLLLGLATLVGCAEGQRNGLNPNIGPARPGLYKESGDAANWRNPMLIIHADAIELIVPTRVRELSLAVPPAPDSPPLFGGPQLVWPIVRPEQRSRINLSSLQQALGALPVTAWPYGGVVWLQETSVIGTVSELPRIAALCEATAPVLHTLRISVEYWPPWSPHRVLFGGMVDPPAP